MQPEALGRLDHLTFKGNLRQTRYGWLRLTPAYSVHLVADLLERHATAETTLLDPYCGTGTTALVCAERGVRCDTTDINPFLLWLARAKTVSYSARDRRAFVLRAALIAKQARRASGPAPWTPPIHQIEKWWSAPALSAIGRVMAGIRSVEEDTPTPAIDLLEVAFCRTMIAHANVSFGHQSMSFKKAADRGDDRDVDVAATWEQSVVEIADAAASEIRAVPSPILCDARDLRAKLDRDRYGCVITSPPYPNRMSYIRELRPYMYWLGHLKDGRAAGELDWQAIGGTWGCATSNVAKWTPEVAASIPYDGFDDITARIAETSKVLGRYVEKYFHDMVAHCRSLFAVVAPGGTVHYIVGNSKFYDVMLPVEQIFAAMFESAGFEDAKVETIRKRTSKKELFEFVVSARKPTRRGARR